MSISNRPFVNAPTRDAFQHVLCDWLNEDNPADVAAAWLDMASGNENGAADLLADQLKKDVGSYYGSESGDALENTLRRYALRRVCWRQIADRLLEIRVTEEPETGDDQGDGGQGVLA